jgi:hypothetical protein
MSARCTGFVARGVPSCNMCMVGRPDGRLVLHGSRWAGWAPQTLYMSEPRGRASPGRPRRPVGGGLVATVRRLRTGAGVSWPAAAAGGWRSRCEGAAPGCTGFVARGVPSCNMCTVGRPDGRLVLHRSRWAGWAPQTLYTSGPSGCGSPGRLRLPRRGRAPPCTGARRGCENCVLVGVAGVPTVGMECSGHCAPNLHTHVAIAAPNVRHLEYFHDHVRIEDISYPGPSRRRKAPCAPT